VASTYRAHVCSRYGDENALTIETRPPLVVGDDELIISNEAFTVGFPDLLTVRGEYQRKPDCPFVPGSEFAGRVLEAGANVRGIGSGDAVIGSVLFGAFAENVLAPAASCFPLPAAFDFPSGAAFLTAYKTAYVGLVERGGLGAGDTLLVTGAAGGVGLAAVELGRILGATVIACASTEAKRAAALAAGANAVIGYDALRSEVKQITDGRGVDVVYEPVGGDCFDEALRCLAPFGRMLVIGFAGGRIPAVAVNYVLLKQISVVGVRAGEFGRVDPAAGRRVTAKLLQLAEAGRLHPRVHTRLPFESLGQAFSVLSSRQAIGRVVIDLGL